MAEDVVVQLEPGKKIPIPKNSKVIVHNKTDSPGQVTWRLDPPLLTQGVVEVPKKGSSTLTQFETAAGTLENSGKVTLSVDIQTKP